MTRCEHDPMLIHALIDGELDVVHAGEVEARIAACAACGQRYAALLAIRRVLAADDARAAAPERLRRRLTQSVRAAAAPARRGPPAAFRRWTWVGSGAGLAIAACAAGLMVALPISREQSLGRELIADHVRSLQVAHLTDVETSDQHVVKPWFSGKLDFSPPVIDLKDQGFPLTGGRLDYLDHRAVAALVYRRGRHVINLFVRPAAAEVTSPAVQSIDGYTLRHWRAGGMAFWAVSDVNPADLAAFEADLRARS